MLQEAMDLLEAGLCVIPLRERSKRPVLARWKPYQSRRPGPEDLKRWFAHGDRNLAVVCGQVSGPPGLSLAVLDFDRPGFEAWAAEYSEIVEQTWITATGRDGGRHVWLVVPDRVGSSAFDHGEVKAEGGYVVAPPSLHPNGRRYRWLNRPDGIANIGTLGVVGLEIAQLRRELRTRAKDGASDTPEAPELSVPDANAHVGATPEHLLAVAQQGASSGTRNRVGFWLAVQMRDNGYDRNSAANVMLCYQVRVANQGNHAYTVTEALRTLESAYRRPPREPWRFST